MIPLGFVVLVVVATVVLGIIATGKTRTAGDLFVAGRSVGVMLNAGAISGEYLSAASFMGIAGLVMKNGYDALWYPVGYAAGYLFLLLFIAGPLRRFGAYTIPDFAEGRFDSPAFRKIAVLFVLSIGLFYTMPQMKGAGVTMVTILGWPYWAGIAVVGTVITFNVALGGMKGITLVQAFQYWLKLFAISAPLFVLAALLGTDRLVPSEVRPLAVPGATVTVKGASAAPSNGLTFDTMIPMRFPEGARIRRISATKATPPGARFAPPLLPLWRTGVRGDGQRLLDRRPVASDDPALRAAEEADRILASRLETAYRTNAPIDLPPGTAVFGQDPPAFTLEDRRAPANGALGKVEFETPTKIEFPGFPSDGLIPVPNTPPDARWIAPYGPLASKNGYPVLWTYSLIVALVCGTAGLPHILVRFYTNPDGRAAKRTTLWVMVLLGAFYVFTPLWGTLGRAAMPALYASNTTDSVVIKLPTVLQNETLGQILSGVTAAGAFAAFMSTFSGLLVSMSGAFAHDVYGRMLRPGASDASRLKAFRLAAVAVGILSMGLGLLVETFDIATMVGWAFAIGAASYFPLLLLGAWWRGLTATGAASGMLLGGFASLSAIVTAMLLDKGVIVADLPPLVRTLLEQPAIWGVPLSLGTMALVSFLTRSKIPSDVDEKMLRLHAPEELGLGRNYVEG